MGVDELQGLIDDGKPADLVCSFCNSTYTFTVDELEDAGEDLMSCIKRTYDYRGDRIQKTIRDLTEEGET